MKCDHVILSVLVATLKKKETGEINFNIFDLTQYIQNLISTYNQYFKINEILHNF